jgi:hypothetical protein
LIGSLNGKNLGSSLEQEVHKLRALVAILWQENKLLKKELRVATKGGSSSMAKSDASMFFNTESVNYELSGIGGSNHQEVKFNEFSKPKSNIKEETRLEEISRTESAFLNPKRKNLSAAPSIEILEFKLINKKSYGNTPRDFYLNYSIEVWSKSDSEKIRLMRIHAKPSSGKKKKTIICNSNVDVF